MKRYMYVLVFSDGSSAPIHASREDRTALASSRVLGKTDPVAANRPFALPRLLEDGWHPAREIAMGTYSRGGLFSSRSQGVVMVLLEREDDDGKS
jgi:hypothetical protein